MQRFARIGLSILAIFASASAAAGQDYPSRPVKLVVPFIAGSPVDALARVVAQQVGSRLGQSVIIENQSGAGGTIGTKAVANAPADGHTLLFVLNAHTYGLYPNPGYDPIRSFAPVAAVAEWSHVLVVRPSLPVRSLNELLARARAEPGGVTFGYGINTPPQVLGETLKIATGLDIRSIPYRGGAQAIADMLGDRIDMNFGATSTLLPLIREGKLRALAYTGATRSGDLPDVPTMAEAGLPQVSFAPDAWTGILAPAGTPDAVVAKLNGAINDALGSAELRASLAKLGYQPRPMTSDAFAAFLVAEMQRWPPIVRAAGLKAD